MQYSQKAKIDVKLLHHVYFNIASLCNLMIVIHRNIIPGWWMVDASGKLGWAPASYLVPVDDGDLAEEAKENEKLMSSMRGI